MFSTDIFKQFKNTDLYKLRKLTKIKLLTCPQTIFSQVMALVVGMKPSYLNGVRETWVYGQKENLVKLCNNNHLFVNHLFHHKYS